jgi:NAD(P)-dependent dehydrogenase (short-subunit alcohol dehydrogenase family)
VGAGFPLGECCRRWAVGWQTESGPAGDVLRRLQRISTGVIRVVVINRMRGRPQPPRPQQLTQYGKVVAVPADLSVEAECLRLAGEVGQHEHALNVLVNNAGATWGAPIEEFPATAWDKVVDLNLKAPFFLTQAFLPLLEAGGTHEDPARVINIGSIDGLRVPPFPTYPYSASKAGLHHLTRVLARELGPRRITVNAVAPGPFESKMMAATLKTFRDAIADAAPLKRIGRPDDMAGVAIYLASRAGAYVTGAVIPVDGGIGTTV